MKKFVLMLLVSAFGLTAVNAATFLPDCFTWKRINGEKANDSCVNPCKGYCDKPCAEIWHLIEAPKPGGGNTGAATFSLGGGQVVVKSILKDPEGNTINEWEEVYDGDVNTVKRQLIEEAAMNGGVTVEE